MDKISRITWFNAIEDKDKCKYIAYYGKITNYSILIRI